MSSKQKKQKKQSRRKSKSKKSKASKNKDNKKRSSYSKNTSKRRTSNVLAKSKRDAKLSRKIGREQPLSLSPFYSFSNHWSHITRQYLCLSTWGTCMGGVNEQYDDLLDQEASTPLVNESYKRAFKKWQDKKSEIDKYNRANSNKYERIRDETLEKAYNITNKNQYNEYNVFNYPLPKNAYQPSHNIFQKPQQQTPPPQIQPIPKQIPIKPKINYIQEHDVPKYSYFPNKKPINVTSSTTRNTENIYNIFNTYNAMNNENLYDDENENNIYNKPSAIKYDQAANISNNNYSGGDQETESKEYDTYEDDENSMYNKPPPAKYDKASNVDDNNWCGDEETETQIQNASTEAKEEKKEDLEAKMYKSGGDDGDGTMEPTLIKKQFEKPSPSPTYLSPDQSDENPDHRKGKSFGRKFSMFEDAAQNKRRRTIEQKSWVKEHHSGSDIENDKQFKQFDDDGVNYVQTAAFHPAAFHVQKSKPRMMDKQDYRDYMKEKEDPNAIITDDSVANLPAKEKIKLFSMLSAETSLDK